MPTDVCAACTNQSVLSRLQSSAASDEGIICKVFQQSTNGCDVPHTEAHKRKDIRFSPACWVYTGIIAI